MFKKHSKELNSTWTDFAYELKNYFQGWIAGLNIGTFDQLSELIIADQIKRRVPQDVREHFIDEWAQINKVEDLVLKLDNYECVRINNKREPCSPTTKKWNKPRMLSGPVKRMTQVPKPSQDDRLKDVKFDNRSNLTCYGCGKPGYIKAKCPSCSVLHLVREKTFLQIPSICILVTQIPVK